MTGLLIGLGGAIGACLRYLVGIWVKKQFQSSFPYSTWFVNITGSFLLGYLASRYLDGQLSESLWYFSGVGFCGAYTTFSTFSFEVVILLSQKEVGTALKYIGTTIFLGIAGCFIGFVL